MFKEKVQTLLSDCLDERQDLFLIDFDVNENNSIKVVIDGDKGVSVNDCMFVSRAIEHNLDREEEDFSLEVTSAGATSPLSHARQYIKNIGRTLVVKTDEGTKIEGELTSADDNECVLEWKTREPKPIGKGKITVEKTATVAYKNIVEAKVKIKF